MQLVDCQLTVCAYHSVSLATLIHAFVHSRLDYCNGLFFGLPKYRLLKLQKVQNAAARVRAVGVREHITPILKKLHWLPVSSRITFKLLTIVHKCVHGSAPDYLCDLVRRPTPTERNLRSSETPTLVCPRVRTNSMRAFGNCAPALRNSLPHELRCIASPSAFRAKLETYFFRISY